MSMNKKTSLTSSKVPRAADGGKRWRAKEPQSRNRVAPSPAKWEERTRVLASLWQARRWRHLRRYARFGTDKWHSTGPFRSAAAFAAPGARHEIHCDASARGADPGFDWNDSKRVETALRSALFAHGSEDARACVYL
ncbi:hypothetical protein MRX96_006541 [Rhipicephalus microplus]